MTVLTTEKAQRPAARAAVSLGRWRIEKRLHISLAWHLASISLAVLGSLGLSSVLIALTGASISEALTALVLGAVGGWRPITETLVKATPLIFTGLAVAVAFRARIFNIGVEGQLVAGAMGAVWVSLRWGSVLPPPALISFGLLVALLLGALTGALVGLFKVRYGASEIIVTVMMNFMILLVLSYVLGNPWRDPASFYYQTALLPDSSHLPRLFPKVRLNLGFLLALLCAGGVYLLLWKTALGYEIRAIGINPVGANYKGIDVAKATLLVMAISGAIGGLAGAAEVPGLHQRLTLEIAAGYGFTGIIVAMLGRLHPVGVVLAAIFLGALANGSSTMQIATNVPVAVVSAIQGILLMFLLAGDVLAQYEIRRIREHG